MKYYLGIDTSNYTTSAAISDENGRIVSSSKRLLNVKEGERGLRQNDAVFAHIKNLPYVISALEIPDKYSVAAIGYSAYPRNVEGSYMPCFEVGKTTALNTAKILGIPAYPFSHQQGHIRAAKYSCGLDELNEFIAFHISGGTTEIMYVKGSSIDKIGGTTDLNAGQAIDRCGVALGLSFPCGPQIERLATGHEYENSIKVSVNDLNCSLSGIENKYMKMISENENPQTVASFTIGYIAKVIDKLTENLQKYDKYKNLPVIYAGGVMSCKIIADRIRAKYNVYFAEPMYSSDNAAGTALLARDKDTGFNER